MTLASILLRNGATRDTVITEIPDQSTMATVTQNSVTIKNIYRTSLSNASGRIIFDARIVPSGMLTVIVNR